MIMPRSPWLASAACTKKAGVPVEAKVAAILRPIWPDLPSPVTISAALGARGSGRRRRRTPRRDRILQRRRQRGDAAAFGLQRAQRRLDGGVRVVGAG